MPSPAVDPKARLQPYSNFRPSSSSLNWILIFGKLEGLPLLISTTPLTSTFFGLLLRHRIDVSPFIRHPLTKMVLLGSLTQRKLLEFPSNLSKDTVMLSISCLPSTLHLLAYCLNRTQLAVQSYFPDEREGSPLSSSSTGPSPPSSPSSSSYSIGLAGASLLNTLLLMFPNREETVLLPLFFPKREFPELETPNGPGEGPNRELAGFQIIRPPLELKIGYGKDIGFDGMFPNKELPENMLSGDAKENLGRYELSLAGAETGFPAYYEGQGIFEGADYGFEVGRGCYF